MGIQRNNLNNPWLDQERHRGWLNQQAENSGRLAQAYATYESTGWGEIAFETCFDFELWFIEPPAVTYGFEMDGDTLVDTRFPRCSGGAYKYRRNRQDFYIGAYVFVTVDTKSPYITTTELEPNYVISHWFTFTGLALKSIGTDLTGSTAP